MAEHIKRVNLKRVYNAPDTTDLKPVPEGNWIGFWRDHFNNTEGKEYYCVCCNKEVADRGGHVWNGRNLPLYIVPLCATCNDDDHKEAFDVPADIMVKETYSDKTLWERKHVRKVINAK